MNEQSKVPVTHVALPVVDGKQLYVVHTQTDAYFTLADSTEEARQTIQTKLDAGSTGEEIMAVYDNVRIER